MWPEMGASSLNIWPLSRTPVFRHLSMTLADVGGSRLFSPEMAGNSSGMRKKDGCLGVGGVRKLLKCRGHSLEGVGAQSPARGVGPGKYQDSGLESSLGRSLNVLFRVSQS